MKTAERIQKDYAEELHYDSFEELLLSDVTEIDWHVANVQRKYASQLTNPDTSLTTIISVIRGTDGMTFSVGDTVKFSERFDSFVLDNITFNANERRVELHGGGLFCSLIESDCKVIQYNALNS